MQLFEYTYLVSYIAKAESGGVVYGRTFFRSNTGKVDQDRIAVWEESIKENSKEKIIDTLVQSFQLLERRLVLFDHKQDRREPEPQVEPRPYQRQLYSNGIWQCDLPEDNTEALRVILERFDPNGGYIELERSDTAEGTIVSEGPEQREWFRAQAIGWLERNPGA